MLNDSLPIGRLILKNRLVMPPMQTGRSDRGHVTADMIAYYRERALYSRPGLIITEHSCISEEGRAIAAQLSIADDSLVDEHRQLVGAIHEAGSLSCPPPVRSRWRKLPASRRTLLLRLSARSRPATTAWRFTAPMVICSISSTLP